MVRHQTEAMDAAAELFDGVLQDQVKPVTVAAFEEDGLAGMAAKDGVLDCAGMMDTGFSLHGRTMANNGRLR